MKRCLSIFLVASFFIACNSGKDKTTSTGKSSTTDSANTNDIVSPGSANQVTVADTIPVPLSRLIIPGKSMGRTILDQMNADAVKHLGPPAMQDAGMGKELATWYGKPLIKGHDTTIYELNIFFTTNMGAADEASRVNQIRLTSPFFATAQHISTGSTLESIQKYFPGIKKIATYISPGTKKEVTIYDDNHSGIAFEIDDRQRCVGITVHKADEPGYETYNALFGDVNFD